MKIFNENNEVIGKVVQDENSWASYWLDKSSYFNEGIYKFIGEYNSFNLAQYKLNEFVHKMNKNIEMENKRFEHKIKMTEMCNKVSAIAFASILFSAFGILLVYIFSN